MCGRYALALEPDNLVAQVQNRLRRNDRPRRNVRREADSEEPQEDSEEQEEEEGQSGGGTSEEARTEDGEVLQGWIGKDDYRPWYNVAPQNRSPVLVIRKEGDEGKSGYWLRQMKWGLVPSWTKRQPDFGTTMKTINARDDTVMGTGEGRGGMWNSQRGSKRCVVIAEGFYEWLKKGSEKIPHFTRHKDGRLMMFAGLWDSVTFEGSEAPLYTYTIITTSSNKQLSFLHDRMPVILSTPEEIQTWLDTGVHRWDDDVKKLLRPLEEELECYPVPKEVGKVGNNSPDFVKPVSERKGNLASFFAKQTQKQSKGGKPSPSSVPSPTKSDSKSLSSRPASSSAKGTKVTSKGAVAKDEQPEEETADDVVTINPDEGDVKADEMKSPGGIDDGGDAGSAKGGAKKLKRDVIELDSDGDDADGEGRDRRRDAKRIKSKQEEADEEVNWLSPTPKGTSPQSKGSIPSKTTTLRKRSPPKGHGKAEGSAGGGNKKLTDFFASKSS